MFRMVGNPPSPLCIPHVGYYPTILNLDATMLEWEYDQLSVFSGSFVADGLAHLYDDAEIDCVVSGYEMHRMDGLEFLVTVRSVGRCESR